jgi:hypothetical protein
MDLRKLIEYQMARHPAAKSLGANRTREAKQPGDESQAGTDPDLLP